ncbi:MAG: hypothetical protein AB1427_00150 [Thermodesulfobacteriota bacterium]
MNDPPNILGIDIGSVAVCAAAVSPDKKILQTAYAFHFGRIDRTLRSVLTSLTKPWSDISKPSSEKNPCRQHLVLRGGRGGPEPAGRTRRRLSIS